MAGSSLAKKFRIVILRDGQIEVGVRSSAVLILRSWYIGGPPQKLIFFHDVEWRLALSGCIAFGDLLSPD
jgi:hypothetical protein